jgi:ribose transport system ATP-binding protein/rhamnose transport system ATP-binding protein
MEIATLRYEHDAWSGPFPRLDSPETVVFAFAAPEYAERPEVPAELAGAFPTSVVMGCSTSGEIDHGRVRDASITVRAGEIVCLAGLVGPGRTEFCEAIFGARPREAGNVALNGAPFLPKGPWDALKAGLGMVCEDRKSGGLFIDTDLASNIAVTVLKRVSAGALISQTRMAALADHYIRELKIATPSSARIVGNLSGGNQQKVLLAKWLALEPTVLIVDEPTRGVDVGARSEIYRILRGLAAEGLALLVVSSDLPEVLALADRIVVMADGRTAGEIAGQDATEEAVLRLATSQDRQNAA